MQRRYAFPRLRECSLDSVSPVTYAGKLNVKKKGKLRYFLCFVKIEGEKNVPATLYADRETFYLKYEEFYCIGVGIGAF